ncbi:MAG: eCIS core domain-containing protein, partial [Gammaproteobacteria bacterium]
MSLSMQRQTAKSEAGPNQESSRNAKSGAADAGIRQAAGNFAVQNLCKLDSGLLGLRVGGPDDPHEREADKASERIVDNMPAVKTPAPANSSKTSIAENNGSGQSMKPNETLQARLHGSGRTLTPPLLSFFEARLDGDFSRVRIHTGHREGEIAKSLRARAFTLGSHIAFAPGKYDPGSAQGLRLLGHELVHVGQQDAAGTAVVRRDLDPAREGDWEDVENPEQFSRLLSDSVERGMQVEQEIEEQGRPGSDAEKEAFAERAQTLVRLNALGMMASHRATVTATRDRLLNDENRRKIESGDPEQSPFADLRKAAALVNDLRAILDRLEDYRSGLHIAHTRTLFRRGSIGDGFNAIVDNGSEFVTAEQRSVLRESFEITQRRRSTDSYWFFLYGATEYLENLRKQQIFGVEQAISHVFQTYPFFSQLDVEDIVEDEDLQSDDALWDAISEAYDDLIEEIDEAIVDIGSGDIHPFDLPRAVALTREAMPAELQTALDEAVTDREVTNFWIGVGIAMAFALLPVVGEILGAVVAGGMGVAGGAAMFGVHLEDMLDRLSIAEASFDPYDDPLGVVAPSAFEWVLLGVEAILVAFGAYSIWRAVRVSPGAIEPSEELLARVGEPSEVHTNRPYEWPYQNPPEMVASQGRRIDVTRLDPNRKYLWVVDREGNFIIAPEEQPGFGVTESLPQGRPVKHGDLVPGEGGQSRGAARAGGELYAERGPDGQPTGR